MSPSHYANNADTLFHRKIIKTDKNYKSAYRFQVDRLAQITYPSMYNLKRMYKHKYRTLPVLHCDIPNATYQGHRPNGSGEEDFFKGFLPNIGVVAILVM